MAPDSEQASVDDTTEAPAAPGYSLSSVLEGARAKLQALGAAALSSTPAPVETPAVLVEASPTAEVQAQEQPQPDPGAQQSVQPEQPVMGAGAFTAPAFATPGPYSASTWQSNPNAGAGQFSTDKGSIDPASGAGPFTTDWHISTSYPY